MQVCSLTIEYQVFQYVPSTSISEQFESILVTIFPHTAFSHGIHFFFFEVVVIDAWSRCFVVLLSLLVCQLTISFHTLLAMNLHIVRQRRNTEILRVWKCFLFPPRKFAIRTWLCNCHQYLCKFHIVFECIPSIQDQGKMLVLPNQLLCWVLFKSDSCFVSFQAI